MKCAKPLYKVLYYIAYILLGWAVKLLFPLRVFGRENLPMGGFVLAPNHLHAIDPVYILLARGFAKKMLVMGKDELFRINPLLNICWDILGAFPVERGAGDRKLLDAAVAEVAKGRGMLIFPEGTRSKDGNLGRLKSGAFVVAWQAGVPLVPCHIRYSAGKPKVFRRIGVVFGKPVFPGELGLEGPYNARALRGAKQQFTAALETLGAEYEERL